jgi:hypothetical protein
MGEIKSTLDLVLEKTRHLTLSDEEKRQQKDKEARDRLAGLLQRYQDNLLPLQKIGDSLDRLVQTANGPNETAVRDEIMERIELDRENQRWLDLLQARYRIETTRVQSIEADYQRAVEVAAERCKEEIKVKLQRSRRISGSAVVPNLDSDPAWFAIRQSIDAEFYDRLAGELDEMKKRPFDL